MEKLFPFHRLQKTKIFPEISATPVIAAGLKFCNEVSIFHPAVLLLEIETYQGYFVRNFEVELIHPFLKFEIKYSSYNKR